MSDEKDEIGRLLTPSEVAGMFRVDPKTVTRWAKAGQLRSVRTLGGHRRYWEDEVQALLHLPSDPGVWAEPAGPDGELPSAA